MIEIENPKDIGSPGSFAPAGHEEEKIEYRNAIGVPYFSRLPEITDTIQVAIGSYLYFK